MLSSKVVSVVRGVVVSDVGVVVEFVFRTSAGFGSGLTVVVVVCLDVLMLLEG